MDLSDEQWADVMDVARKKALAMTHGQQARAEDLAGTVIERLFAYPGTVDPSKLRAFVRKMTQNAYLDQEAKIHAAYRGGPSLKHPMDENIHALADEIGGVYRFALHASSPSAALVRRERSDERRQAYLDILESLPDKQRQLVEMSARDVPQAEIARALGYANAAVVKSTLQRVYKRIRLQYDDQYGTLFDSY